MAFRKHVSSNSCSRNGWSSGRITNHMNNSTRSTRVNRNRTSARADGATAPCMAIHQPRRRVSSSCFSCSTSVKMVRIVYFATVLLLLFFLSDLSDMVGKNYSANPQNPYFSVGVLLAKAAGATETETLTTTLTVPVLTATRTLVVKTPTATRVLTPTETETKSGTLTESLSIVFTPTVTPSLSLTESMTISESVTESLTLKALPDDSRNAMRDAFEKQTQIAMGLGIALSVLCLFALIALIVLLIYAFCCVGKESQGKDVDSNEDEELLEGSRRIEAQRRRSTGYDFGEYSYGLGSMRSASLPPEESPAQPEAQSQPPQSFVAPQTPPLMPNAGNAAQVWNMHSNPFYPPNSGPMQMQMQMQQQQQQQMQLHMQQQQQQQIQMQMQMQMQQQQQQQQMQMRMQQMHMQQQQQQQQVLLQQQQFNARTSPQMALGNQNFPNAFTPTMETPSTGSRSCASGNAMGDFSAPSSSRPQSSGHYSARPSGDDFRRSVDPARPASGSQRVGSTGIDPTEMMMMMPTMKKRHVADRRNSSLQTERL